PGSVHASAPCAGAAVIPVEVDDVTAEWLGGAVGRPVAVVAVVARHSATTGRARVRVRWGDGEPGAETLFVKMPPFDPGQRTFVTAAGLGVAEARFYAEVAAEVPVRVPAVLASQWDADGRFAIVLEDLGTTQCRF